MNNLVIIGTPGHYFNLIECLDQLNIKKENCDLIFLNFPSDIINNTFINQTVIREEWHSFHKISVWEKKYSKLNPYNIFIILCFFFKTIAKFFLKKYNKVIVNQINQFCYRFILSIVKANKTISLDEGNFVLKFVYERYCNDKKRKYFFPIPNELIFFTAYSFEVQNNDSIIPFNYSKSKRQVSLKKLNQNEEWFIGSPILEDGLIPKNIYWEKIKEICISHNFKRIKYFPHRREENYKLKILKNDFNFEIVKTFLPVELFLTKQNMLPGKIKGFSSAAILNLNKILEKKEVEFSSFYLSFDWDKDLKPTFDKIYLDLKSRGIKVID